MSIIAMTSVFCAGLIFGNFAYQAVTGQRDWKLATYNCWVQIAAVILYAWARS